MSLSEFLAYDPLAGADAKLRRREAFEQFHSYLPLGAIDVWSRILAQFVRTAPLRYWDIASVDQALEVLEASPDRTAQAMTAWSREIGIGFENLFRHAPTSMTEENLDVNKTRDLLYLATQFHPEYLRYCEHIFGNLIRVYWGILRKGAVKAKFDLPAAATLLKDNPLLVAGYDDRVRNAIAHGEIVYKGLTIQYGPDIANYELTSREFLHKFDSLIRSSNTLAISLLLVLARHYDNLRFKEAVTLPLGLIRVLTAAQVERPGLQVNGLVESVLPATGRQLHVAVHDEFRNQHMVLLDASRVAFQLVQNGALGYSRVLVDINHGTNVSSLVTIDSMRLESLIREGASWNRLNEIIAGTPFLWFHESKFRNRLRAWKLIARSHGQLAWTQTHEQWRSIGLRRTAGRYRIRKVENRSASGIGRVHVSAVLRHPEEAGDRELVMQIVRAIIKDVSRQWVNPRAADINRRWSLPRRPSYVWVALYRVDGTIRWLGRGGWAGGNVVALGEKIHGPWRKPILVRNSDTTWKGVRYQFGMKSRSS